MEPLNLLTELIGHQGKVWHASWSFDGTKIASCGEDRTLRIWSFSSELFSVACICILEETHSRTVRSCEWSPSGKILASASFDGKIIIWNASNRALTKWEVSAVLEGHDSEVKSISWNMEGNLLASCGRDKRIWIWECLDKHDFECVAVLDGHSQDVKFVKFHPSDDVLFSSSYDNLIKIWGKDEGDWYCLRTLIGHTGTVWGGSFNSLGSAFVSCSEDLSIILWQCESQTDPSQPWNKVSISRNIHDYPIYTVSWKPMSNLILSGGGDNTINCLRSLMTEDKLYTLDLLVSKQSAHNGDINCIRWNPSLSPHSEGVFLSAGDDESIRIWRLNAFL